ncbi:MAG: hypothetical protein NXI24_16675 [bacterium]|nr:hypothetical protein [bacterium]
MDTLHQEFLRLVEQTQAPRETIESLRATIRWLNEPAEVEDSLPGQYLCCSRNISDLSLNMDTMVMLEFIDNMFQEHGDAAKIFDRIQPDIEYGYAAPRCPRCSQFIRPKSRTFLSVSEGVLHFACFLAAPDRGALAAGALPGQINDFFSDDEPVLYESSRLIVRLSKIERDAWNDLDAVDEIDELDDPDESRPVRKFLLKSTLSKFTIEDLAGFTDFRAKIFGDQAAYLYPAELDAVREACHELPVTEIFDGGG